MPTVAGYARLSIAKDTSVSIAAQHQTLQRWAEVHDRPITLYTDDGYSGSKAIERPAFERMLAGVAAGEHDTVVVKSIDRLGRRLRGFIDLADQVRIVTVEGGIDTGTATGRMMLSLLSTFAEFEAAQIGQRQAVSQAYRREQGRAVGLPPFGYTHAVVDGISVRVVAEAEARVVVDIIESVFAGSSLRSIADRLNSAGTLTRRGLPWSAATIGQLIANPAYAGYRQVGSELVRGSDGLPVIDHHLALVSLEEWRRLEQARAGRRAFAPKGARHERLLLHGIAVCGTCGGMMTRGQTTSRGTVYAFYRCGQDARTRCSRRVTISATALDGYIAEQVSPLLGLAVMERVVEADQVARDRRALLLAELDALGESMGRASTEDMAGIFERMQALRVQVDALVVPTVETMRATGEVLGDLWARDRRLVIEQAIERVHVLPATTKRSPVGERVVVEWKG